MERVHLVEVSAAADARAGARPEPSLPVGPSRWRRRGRDLVVLVTRRLAVTIPIVVVVSLGVFLLARFSPFDPLVAYLGDAYQTASLEQREQIGQALGLGDDWFGAWLTWVGGLLGGDLGHSRVFRAPVTEVIAERLPFTLLLSGTGLLLALALALVFGVAAGLRPGSLLDRLAEGISVVLQAIPAYVTGLLAIIVIALGLGLAPTGGVAPAGMAPTWGDIARHLVLPAAVLGISQMPWMLLSVRASVRSALASDAVAGAVARGLPPRTIIRGHVLPVSLAPVVTLVGARLPELVVGAVLVEEVFGWPGLASATVSAARALDFPLLAALTLGTTLVVLLGNLLADAAYLLLDPRVSHD